MVKIFLVLLLLFCSCCGYRRVQWSLKLIGDDVINVRPGKQYPEIIGKMHGSIFLSCKVEFVNPAHNVRRSKIKFQWFRNKEEIKLPPPYDLFWNEGSVLMVRPLLHDRTNGLYECKAEYSGVTKTRGVEVIIKNKNNLPKGFPVIMTHPGHVRTLRNTVDFHCVMNAAKDKPLRIIWFHDRVPLKTSPNYVVSTMEIDNIYSSNLKILNVTATTKGFFQCVAMNEFGQTVSKQGNIQFSDKKNDWRNDNRHKRTLTDSKINQYYNSVGNNQCLLTESDSPAGIPRNVTVKCRCTPDADECFYEIKWVPPEPGGAPVTNYRVTFYKYGLAIPNCFIVPTNTTSFIFDKEKGFDFDSFRYTVSVTAEPIKRENNLRSVRTVFADYCPEELSIVNQLPNAVIEAGADYTFHCNYQGTPGPDSVNWAFSADVSECKDPQRITNETLNINISDDNKQLEVLTATQDQSGCYVCNIENAFFTDTQHGYLRVLEKSAQKKRVLGPVLGGVTGGILVVLIAITLLKWFGKKPIPTFPEKTVYVSHCTENETSKIKLLKFVSVLQMCNINVSIDLCSEVSINIAGGISHWIPECMRNASKILVVLSKDYVRNLAANAGGQCCNDEICGCERTDSFCKVRAEYNIMHKMIYYERTNKLVLVCDDVTYGEFPELFKGRPYYMLPKNLNDYTNNTDFLKILEVLTEHEQVGWFRMQ